MEKEKEDLVVVQNYRCSCTACFYCWEDTEKRLVCRFCEENAPLNDQALLKRVIDILPQTQVSSIPNVLRLLYRVLEKNGVV